MMEKIVMRALALIIALSASVGTPDSGNAFGRARLQQQGKSKFFVISIPRSGEESLWLR